MLRNKFLSAVLLAASLSVGIWGCGTDKETTTSTSTPLVEFNKTMTLQGKIINATTGAAIGGADLKVYLIQGTTNRTPDKLITDTADNNVGEYAFSGIPVALNKSIAYKVVAINTGYQRFEGECLFDYVQTAAADPIDTTYNWIGNIYLYPIGTPAGDVTIYVKTLQNKPVSGATVLLRQKINGNIAANGTTTSVNGGLPGTNIASTTLTNTASLVQSLSGTTGTDGKVTFAGTTLALGGNYEPVVMPLTIDGQQLAKTAGSEFIVGTVTGIAPSVADAYQTITMADVEPASYLYVTSASNSTVGTVTSTGVLTLVFNRAVLIDTAAGAVTGTLSGASGGVLASTAASLSADGLTLTITPTFTTAPTAKGASISYTLNNIIYIKDTQVNSTRTFSGAGTDLTNVYGTVVSRAVQLLTW